MTASVLEVYNDSPRDLLATAAAAAAGGGDEKEKEKEKRLVIRSDTATVEVAGLVKEKVQREEEVYALLSRAQKNRSVACTDMNAHSSRSHLVFLLRLEGTNEKRGKRLRGCLCLVDLAGSER